MHACICYSECDMGCTRVLNIVWSKDIPPRDVIGRYSRLAYEHYKFDEIRCH